MTTSTTSMTGTFPAVDETPAVAAFTTDIVGRTLLIRDADSDAIHLDLADVTRLRERLEQVEADAERVLAVRSMTDGLCELADWLDAHPTVRVSPSLTVAVHAVGEEWTTDRTAIEHAAQIMGVPTAIDLDMSDETREYVQAELTFGPITLRASTYCEPTLRAVPA